MQLWKLLQLLWPSTIISKCYIQTLRHTWSLTHTKPKTMNENLCHIVFTWLAFHLEKLDQHKRLMLVVASAKHHNSINTPCRSPINCYHHLSQNCWLLYSIGTLHMSKHCVAMLPPLCQGNDQAKHNNVMTATIEQNNDGANALLPLPKLLRLFHLFLLVLLQYDPCLFSCNLMETSAKCSQ
jgi:hypothetical protein